MLKYCPLSMPHIPSHTTLALSGSVRSISLNNAKSFSLSHSLHLYVVVIAKTFSLGLSKNRAFSQLLAEYGLNVRIH